MTQSCSCSIGGSVCNKHKNMASTRTTNELYTLAYNNIRSGSRSAIINGYNQFAELEKLSVQYPLSLSEIHFNQALAARQLQDVELFRKISKNTSDSRIAQLEQLLLDDVERKSTVNNLSRQTKRFVQQISCCLLGASALIFFYRA